MALAVNRVIADFDEGFKKRTKPLRLTFSQIEGIWVPMLACDYCGVGPITSLDDDSCCVKHHSPTCLHKEPGVTICNCLPVWVKK